MHEPDLVIMNAELRITGTEAEGLLLYRPCEELALAESVICANPVAIQRECRLVFGNSLREPALCAQYRALARRASRLCGDAAKACPASRSARAMSAAAESAI